MAEKTTAGTTTTSETGHPKKFPPLDPTTFTPQLAWLLLTFVLLYVLLARVALPRIGKVMEERRERRQRDLTEAERLQTETNSALAAYEQSRAEARGKAQAIAKEMRDTLAAEADRERHRVDAEIAAKLAETERQIADTKSRALAGINQIAADTVSAIVAKLTGQEANADEIRRALAGQPAE